MFGSSSETPTLIHSLDLDSHSHGRQQCFPLFCCSSLCAKHVNAVEQQVSETRRTCVREDCRGNGKEGSRDQVLDGIMKSARNLMVPMSLPLR